MQIWTNYETHNFKKWGYVTPLQTPPWLRQCNAPLTRSRQRVTDAVPQSSEISHNLHIYKSASHQPSSFRMVISTTLEFSIPVT